MSEPATTIRAFISLNLPPEIQAFLEALLRRLKRPLARAGITWMRPEQIHLTLKFLGDIPAEYLQDLQDAIHRACSGVPKISLQLSGLGVFPDQRRPCVIWAGLKGDLTALAALQERIEAAALRWREREARPFHPHLTLGRGRHIRPAEVVILREKLAVLAPEVLGDWMVDRVELMRSELTSGEAIHSPLAHWDLE